MDSHLPLPLFYKPADGWCGDFIPFYWQGRYHLFYLKDWRDKENHGPGTPWFHLSTADFVAYRDHGEALSRGGPREQDAFVFTGSVFEKDGIFHIFYTGHNDQMVEMGGRKEVILHGTSPDLDHWTKDSAFALGAPLDRCEPHDWRDPFVFWNPQAGQYEMLVTARHNHGPVQRRGCVMVCRSPDLARWTVGEPLWSPGLHQTHECPDLFRMGDWWYLIYSSFTGSFATHYRMARSLEGPWIAPTNDTFDGRGWYAAKTASDGRRRFAFGWNSTRNEEKDLGGFQWGGNLAVHEILQQSDGTLAVRCPAEVAGAFSRPLPVKLEPRIGSWLIEADRCQVRGIDRFSWCRLGETPKDFRLETQITIEPGTRACGVVVRADENLDRAYEISLEAGSRRLALRGGVVFYRDSLLERYADIPLGRPMRLAVLMEGSVIEVYLDDRLAMSARGYELTGPAAGLFVSEGAATFAGTTLSSLA